MAGLLDNIFATSQDDPRYAANMALFGNMVKGDFGGGLLAASQAGAQARTAQQEAQYRAMQIQNMQAEAQQRAVKAQQEQAALERQRQIQQALPSLFGMPGGAPQGMPQGAPQQMPQSAPMGGQSMPMPEGEPMEQPQAPMQAPMQGGGFDARRAALLGMDPDLIEKYVKLQNAGMPEVARTINVPGPNGEKMVLQLDKFGRPVGKPMTEFEAAQMVDRGGSQEFVIPRAGLQLPKTGNPYSDLLLSDGKGGVRPNSALIGAKAQIARAGASNVNVTTKQETEEAKTVGKFFGENYADVQKAGFTAQSSINRIDRLGQLLNGVDTGKFAPLGVEVAKTAQSLGLNIDPKLSNKEAAVALSSEIALQLRNPSGGAGMPGAMSDADRNFLAGMVPGIEKTPQGRAAIMETAKKLAKRDIEVAKMAREYRQKNGTINEGFYNELARYSEANPLFGRSASPAPAGGTNIDALLKKYGQ